MSRAALVAAARRVPGTNRTRIIEPIHQNFAHVHVSPRERVIPLERHRASRLSQASQLGIPLRRPPPRSHELRPDHHVVDGVKEQFRLHAVTRGLPRHQHRAHPPRVRAARESRALVPQFVQRRQRHGAPERVPEEEHPIRVDPGQLRRVSHRGARVVPLGDARPRPLTPGEAHAAKVKSHGGDAGGGEPPREVRHQRVAHVAPEVRVRVAHHDARAGLVSVPQQAASAQAHPPPAAVDQPLQLHVPGAEDLHRHLLVSFAGGAPVPGGRRRLRPSSCVS